MDVRLLSVAVCFVVACSGSDGGVGGTTTPASDGGTQNPGQTNPPGSGTDGGDDPLPDGGAPDGGTPDSGGTPGAGLFANINETGTQFTVSPQASVQNQFDVAITGRTTNDPLTSLDLRIDLKGNPAPGVYQCTPAGALDPRATVSFTDNVNHHDFPTTADAQVGACTVTVTAIGTTPGTHVIGTFTATTTGQGNQKDVFTGGTFDVVITQ